jgi:hypothetical protein
MSALGRERVATVAVALTDLAVTPLDEHLALLVDGDVPRTVNRLLLHDHECAVGCKPCRMQRIAPVFRFGLDQVDGFKSSENGPLTGSA